MSSFTLKHPRASPHPTHLPSGIFYCSEVSVSFIRGLNGIAGYALFRNQLYPSVEDIKIYREKMNFYIHYQKNLTEHVFIIFVI